MAATFLRKHSAIRAPQNIICPDGTSECDSNSTCCIDVSGGYSCCSGVRAVCCADRQHCCPLGTACDVGAGTCPQVNVVCPDYSLCPLNQTCCVNASGNGYACCPQPNAVCCSDGVHCCPTGTTCNLSINKCIQESFLTSVSTSKAAHCSGGKACHNRKEREMQSKAINLKK